jgi:hypothetical protein
MQKLVRVAGVKFEVEDWGTKTNNTIFTLVSIGEGLYAR